MSMILVSSSLAGLEVRYNGTHCLDHKISKLIEEEKAITVCPELLGGFSTPREPADGKAKVVEKSGRDVTELYIKGAYTTLKKAVDVNATVIVLKEYSPSCGSSMIYNGEFIGEKIAGNGVTAALLKRNGLQVISDKQFADNFVEII
jgi:uncharacterized protein YbbK (DUF523 family)